jgi:D-glycero-D-manno-heptose 1,7-bisphosphate phosphatase
MTLDVSKTAPAATARANLPALRAAARAHPGEVVAWRQGGRDLLRLMDGEEPPPDRAASLYLSAADQRGPGAPEVILLDRDGTLIEDRHYLAEPDRVALLPGALEGLAALSALGHRLVVVTNQSGVARGLVSPTQLEAVHARLTELLAEGGVRLDGIYSCPHDAVDRCACRKPATGLAERAAADLGLDPTRAIVVGDKVSDLELGRALGVSTVLVATGYGARTLAEGRGLADFMIEDLRELGQMAAHSAGFPVLRRAGNP